MLLRFLVTISILTLTLLLSGIFFIDNLPSSFFQTLTFLFLSTAALFYYLLKVKATRPDHFVMIYLLTMVVKLTAYLSYLIIIVKGNQEGMIENVVFFMGVYFLFTALEIGFLYRRVNS